MAKLIGNAPNQVPTNADLGSMAFEDKKNYATTSSPIYQPFRNIIINGDMSIAQRSTSVSSISSGGAYNTVDRLRLALGTAGTWTQSQSTDVPSGQGFAKSLKMDCTTANASLSSGSYLNLQYKFEGQNLQYLKKGTSSAESLTLSFWVKSNKTGTYNIVLRDTDNTREIGNTYTIDSASTWEKKTLTFAGDTTGAFNNDNAESLRIFFWLAAGTSYTSGTTQTSWGSVVSANQAVGQVNLADSTSNEFYITGVQLEAGTTASDFEFLPHDVNLQRCQRYYYKLAGQSGQNYMNFGMSSTNGTSSFLFVNFPVSLRNDASISSSGTFSSNVPLGGSYENVTAGPSIGDQGPNLARIDFSTSTSYSAGLNGRILVLNDGNAFIAFDAEL